jgi:N-acetylmuramoyl-L-alanine amidase/Glycosyl hydrolases family 25
MGSRYLTDLAEVCRRTGYPVIEVDDWPHRARGSGGFDSGRPNHVMAHHTASGPSSDGWPDVNYCTFNDSDAPLCNLYISRNGTIYVCAGGATNTNGSGSDPCGTTNDDSMNSSAIGIEAGNNGTGEAWPADQTNCYVKLSDELCSAYGIPAARVHSHFEWAPERKKDPAGPSPWASGSSMWNMDAFRDDVEGGGAPAPPKYAQGIDVSKWQGKIDWAKVKSAGYTWVATRTWDRDLKAVDTTFAYNRDGMAFATWRLLYYWLEPGRVNEGIDEFFRAVGTLRPGEGAMLDAEEEGITEDECVKWCEGIEARTGVPCAVYTGGYTAGGVLWRSDKLFNGERARIFAAYTSEEEARGHADGIAWDAWQYSATGTVPGVDGDCDLDRIDNGAAFTRCLVPGGTTPPPVEPPDTGGKDMAAIMPTIKKGNSGPYVERMQHLLAAAGFMNPGNTANYDGQWGSGTDGAKKEFDKAHNLGSSNTDCGPKSWESLLTGKKW